MGLITELKKENIPDSVESISESEGVNIEKIIRGVINGQIVIPANIKRRNVKPTGIGFPLKTKVNANIRTSTDQVDVDLEVRKAIAAEEAGRDTIMDLQLDEI